MTGWHGSNAVSTLATVTEIVGAALNRSIRGALTDFNIIKRTGNKAVSGDSRAILTQDLIIDGSGRAWDRDGHGALEKGSHHRDERS
jgi:hypothetical protein